VEELVAADVGVVPLAVPGRLEKGVLTDAFLLTGLRVRRDVAARIFRGVTAMHESDTQEASRNDFVG